MRDTTSNISIDILNGCKMALDLVERNIQEFVQEKAILKAILTDNKLLSELVKKMNVDAENPNQRQNKLFEIILAMFKLEKLIRSKEKLEGEEQPFSICVAQNQAIKEYADAIDVIYEGANFTTQLDDIWFNGLLYSNDSHLLSHIGESFQTDRRMYQMKFQKTYKAQEHDMRLSIGKHTSDALI